MKIVLATIGTDGDVRPLIALGKFLKAKGHEIILCAPDNNEKLVAGFGLDYQLLGIDMKEILMGNKSVFSRNSARGLGKIRSLSEKMMSLQETVLMERCRDADCLIGSGNMLIGRMVAECYDIPFRYVFHIPQMIFSKAHPPVLVTRQNLPSWMNLLFWKLTFTVFNLLWRDMVNSRRGKKGLEPIKDIYTGCYNRILLAADRSLTSLPENGKDDYDRTGYWYLDEEGGMQEELEEFLKTDKPVVYVGFGSMAGPSKRSVNSIMEEIEKRTDLRFVVSKGWAGLESAGKVDHVRFVDYVPHHILFQKVNLIVHHGGAGTVHTAARAGKPQIIVPHMGDQFYWGERIYRLGLGPRPAAYGRLNGKALMNRIDYVLREKDFRNTAAAMAVTLSKEPDGREELASLLGL